MIFQISFLLSTFSAMSWNELGIICVSHPSEQHIQSFLDDTNGLGMKLWVFRPKIVVFCSYFVGLQLGNIVLLGLKKKK